MQSADYKYVTRWVVEKKMAQKFGERLLCVVNLHWERG
jgi:hypothetical protein